MKKNYTNLVIAAVFIFCGIAQSKSQTIRLDPKIGGSSGSALVTDASTFQISASGVVSYVDSPEDWTMTSQTITQTGALGKNFIFKWGGMASVNTTEGNDYGKMLSPGGIHRNSAGELGIAQGAYTGIERGEGIYFGLDLSNLGADVAVQITKIKLPYITTANEAAVIVSLLDPSKRINIGTTTANEIDVSSLRLYVAGGNANNAIVSVFNNSPSTVASDWRIDWIELKIVPLSTLPVSYAQNILLDPTTTANGGSAGSTLYTDESTFHINASGGVSYYNSNGAEDWDLTAETITQPGALGKTFKLNWGAMATVNTAEGSNYGKMLDRKSVV